MIDPEKKILYWCIGSREINILIPKKRSTGFLKQPVGHHSNALSLFITDELSMNCCGLDGYLCLSLGHIDNSVRGRVEEIIGKLSGYYGLKTEEVSHNEFFDYVLFNI